MFIYEYKIFLIYIIVMIFIFSLLVFINLMFIFRIYNNMSDSEKVSSYECGFQAFELNIVNFEINYYILIILFLLFDLELIFFIPFILSVNFLNFFSIIIVFIFFFLLILSFFYEWKIGVLNFFENF